MAIKKSELYSSIWKACDELRGGMEPSEYKNYILIFLFIRYISDKAKYDPNSLVELPEWATFDDIVGLKWNPEIGDKINKIIIKILDATGLSDISVADFNDERKLGKGKELVDRLTKIIGIFENPAFNFAKNNASHDDLIGDAYEYLMKQFASESGKWKGEFYTPAEVSRVMSRIIGIDKAKSAHETVYDPTCGSGSLLLKAVSEAPYDVTIYGQEINESTSSMARMNMFLHNNETADIRNANTLSNPLFIENGQLKQFDYIVANPPFSLKTWNNGFSPEHDTFLRFEDGIPPAKNGDYAFLSHIIKSLKTTGSGAVILPHGVLFRGNAEAIIRENILKKWYIKGIIGLPANLFFGTSIPACIIVLDKSQSQNRHHIFMMDASKWFIKDGNKNRLREQDIFKIVETFNNEVEIPKYSRKVPLAEIRENDYNLNIPRYIDTAEEADIHSIEGHLYGGIPDYDIAKLSDFFAEFPTLKASLLREIRPDFYELAVSESDIFSHISKNAEFKNFQKNIFDIFEKWKTSESEKLAKIDKNSHPKNIVNNMAISFLETFHASPLVDEYALFQHIVDYANNTLQDDIYAIIADGWTANANIEKNKRWEITKISSEILPTEIIEKKFFEKILDEIAEKEWTLENLQNEIADAIEEQKWSDENLLEEVLDDDKIDQKNLANRIKELKKSENTNTREELMLLVSLEQKHHTIKNLKSEIKIAKNTLLDATAQKYLALDTHELQNLIIVDKWMNYIEQTITEEIQKITQNVATKLAEYHERYNETMTTLDRATDASESKVHAHLEKLGFNF